jgi:hypothetical protein
MHLANAARTTRTSTTIAELHAFESLTTPQKSSFEGRKLTFSPSALEGLSEDEFLDPPRCER